LADHGIWLQIVSVQDDMTAAITALYAAATGAVPWEQALDRVLEATGFEGAALWALPRFFDASAGRTVWHRLDPGILGDYLNHYNKIDPRRQLAGDPINNRISFDYRLFAESEIDRNPYYAWYQPASGMRYHIGGFGRPDLPFFAGVTLHRPRSYGHASDAEIDRFRLLFDHLERALEVAYRLSIDHGVVASLAGLSLTETTGCVFLDRAGRPMFVNDMARRIADNRYVILTNAGVMAPRHSDNRRLQTLIGQCIATVTGQGIASGGAMRLPGPDGGSGFAVTVSPLCGRDDGALATLGPAVCILFVDPAQDRSVDEVLLRELYRLSPAEAALAQRMVIGDTLQQAARTRGIGVSTARSYLEQIFQKTETNRQADLVRFLLSLPRASR
jgi:DNA-binding CsgD family transcriptional regulator